MYFQWMTQKPPFQERAGIDELREHAERLLQSKVSDEVLHKRPSIALEGFFSNDSFARLTDFFGWIIERIRQVEP